MGSHTTKLIVFQKKIATKFYEDLEIVEYMQRERCETVKLKSLQPGLVNKNIFK